MNKPFWTKWRHLMFVLLVPLVTSGCGERYLVLNPAGPVARIEQRLIILTIVMVLIVVIPVIILTAVIVARYRDRPDRTAPYMPEWSESKVLEVVWWGIPIVIIGIIGTFTVRDTFRLVKPQLPEAPLTIQVTSLNWKWLFQYPDQNIATVNYCKIPTNRPVEFVLTSDAPMNSFWVPQLGGQEYTMPGMAMRLWLQADKPGVYFGHGANFTGKGYAKMAFDVVATDAQGFDQWTKQVKASAPPLTKQGYKNLTTKQDIVGKQEFSSFPPGMFEADIRINGGMYMKHQLKEATD
ncbi:cytochrome c oxidase subunit II [Alicyclobacillus ferrooxydans]|uniref:Quinol oxidase subunit 2 n=1 Tax=Alicyclobacillus ferrooxydans TaxID=471514 RepID=A0A0P9CSK6_9BACL|nr:cytochrome c oxidase subunit II [Alicyclobacillus ferrooxydans]KPV42620.1 cytochrome C oxidase subunit II [Alicyclobacillus ferrooxydans]